MTLARALLHRRIKISRKRQFHPWERNSPCFIYIYIYSFVADHETNRALEKIERSLLRFRFLSSRAFLFSFFRYTWKINLPSELRISALSYLSILASFQRCC